MSGHIAIDRVDAVLQDPLRDGRESGTGVAFVGPDLPIEILLASGRPFGHLPWQADRPTPWADQWLESSFPFWARSILEQWHDGDFDGLAQVVFSRAGDASQRLYYYVAELRRRGKLSGPTPLAFDIALVPRATSLAHTAAAVAGLMTSLEVDATMLADGIGQANHLRRRIAKIEQARAADGPYYERLWRAALWSNPCAWIEAVADGGAARRPSRVLLAGSMPPDDRIHRAVESGGASVVAEMHALAAGRLGPEFDPGSDEPALALARHLREHSVSPRAFVDRASLMVQRAQAARADAAVIWLTREDEALAWSAPAALRALDTAGLPTLMLTAARWQADGETPERIMEFCRGFVRAGA